MFYPNRYARFLTLSLSLILLSLSSFASSSSILPAPKKISDHVYAWIGPYGGPNPKNKGYRMNMAFVVGKKSVAVIDTGFYPAMAKEMVKHIKKITKLPIKYAINTGSQPHRFLGNDVFRQSGANIVTSAKEATRMEQNGNNYLLMLENVMKMKKVSLPKAPNKIINKGTKLDLGGDVILDIHLHKAAHTPQPLIVHVPSDNIVYAGDILYSGRLLGIVAGGNIREWMDTYNYLKRFKGVTFIPGHGQPGSLATFQKSTFDYLVMLDKHMTKMLDDGVDMQDAIRKLDQSAFSGLANFNDLAGRNANRAYQEAERAAFE